MSINKVILLGNVGHTPETGNFEGGDMWAKFSLATSSHYTNKQGEKVTDTEWHNCVAYGKICDVINKYVEKGKPLAIIGKLRTRNYDGRDGIKKYITEIVVKELTLLGGRSNNNSSAPPPPPSNQGNNNNDEAAPVTPEPDDDLPF